MDCGALHTCEISLLQSDRVFTRLRFLLRLTVQRSIQRRGARRRSSPRHRSQRQLETERSAQRRRRAHARGAPADGARALHAVAQAAGADVPARRAAADRCRCARHAARAEPFAARVDEAPRKRTSTRCSRSRTRWAIRQEGTTFDIVSAVESRRVVAGSRTQVSMPEGELADSKVGWDGQWFVIERRVRGGPRVVGEIPARAEDRSARISDGLVRRQRARRHEDPAHLRSRRPKRRRRPIRRRDRCR